MARTGESQPSEAVAEPPAPGTTGEPAVAARVTVQLDSGETVAGTIIEDFADMMPTVGEVWVRADERRTVTLRRWGVAVDNGTIVFVDNADLEVLQTGRDHPSGTH